MDKDEMGDRPARRRAAETPRAGDPHTSEETTSAVGHRFRALELERHIGERLRFLRRLSGFSLQLVAKEIGVSFQQIQKYECGTNRVSAGLLAEFSNLFHLPMDWFIGPFNTCIPRDELSGSSIYVRVMHQLFRGLRYLDDTDCDTALGVVCRIAKVAPGMPGTRLVRLRQVLQNGTPEANEFILEVITRLADAHVCSSSSNRTEVLTNRILPSNKSGMPTVLLVDDDPDVIEALSASLSMAGFEVRSARSSNEAISVLSRNIKIDVLVADYAMDRMDGVELLANAEQLRPGLPGIVITGFADATRLRALPDGIEVLSKPFRRMELIGRLRLLIDARGGMEPARRQPPLLRLIT